MSTRMSTGKKIAIIVSSVIGGLLLFFLFTVLYIGPKFASLSKGAGDSPSMGAREWMKLSTVSQTKIVQEALNEIHYAGPIKAEHITSELKKGFDIVYPTSDFSIGDSVDVELSKERLAFVEEEIKQKSDDAKLVRLQQFSKTPPELSYSDQEQVKKEIADLSSSIESAKAKQEKAKSAPLKIINSYVDKNMIGTPQAHVIVQNVSNKTIDAYKFSAACFNSFGDPVSDGISNEFHGINQEITVAPGETAGESKYWLLAVQDTTTKIVPAITEVHFTDGTTWSADN